MGKLKPNQRNFLLLALIIIIQLIIYLPHVGTGFVKDDFVWLESILANQEVDYLKPFIETTGFYRPLVSLTFGLQFEWFDLNSRPFGFFNLFLHVLNIIMVFLLFSSIKSFRSYALLVTFLFAMSIKSSTMAVGWISGRTTLMFSFFSLLSFYLYLKNKQPYFCYGGKLKIIFLYFFVGIFYFAALMSKESAAALPLFVVLFNFWNQEPKKKMDVTLLSGLMSILKRLSKAVVSTSIYILPLVFYFFFRQKSNAFTPFNTPEYYRYTLAPLVLLKNLVEYVSRSIIFDFFLFICLIFLILVFMKKKYINQGLNRFILKFGTLWFLCIILPILPLAVRSDIYIYLPQLGLHLIFAVLILPLWKAVFLESKSIKQRNILFIPILALLIVWLGYFWLRTSAYGEEGKNSAQFSREILKLSAGINKNNRIVIIDMNKDNSFSPLNSVAYGFNSLLRLYLSQKNVRGEIVSPTQLSEIKCDNKALRFFFHKNNLFVGPLKCYQLRNLLISISPQIIKHQKILGKKRYKNRKRGVKAKNKSNHR